MSKEGRGDKEGWRREKGKGIGLVDCRFWWGGNVVSVGVLEEGSCTESREWVNVMVKGRVRE